MKHAGAEALAQLEALLIEVRRMPGLVERKPGTFYRRAQAFLHFHEDASGLFADAKLDGQAFERFSVSTKEEQRRLLSNVRKTLLPPTR